jgi:hypothetical protein
LRGLGGLGGLGGLRGLDEAMIGSKDARIPPSDGSPK